MKKVLIVLVGCMAWILMFCEVGGQIWFPGSGNLYVRICEDRFVAEMYGDRMVEATGPLDLRWVCLAESQRSVLRNGEWIGVGGLAEGSNVIAGERMRKELTETDEYWLNQLHGHYHDYECQSTDIMTREIEVSRWVAGGDIINCEGYPASIEVIETPGETRSGITYILHHEVSGERWMYSGGMMDGSGRLGEFYRYQDSIPEAGLRGYHGYAGRVSELLQTLRKLQNVKVDRHFTAFGEIEGQRLAVMNQLEERVIRLYDNYLSTSALHWYFGGKFLSGSFERLGGEQILPVGPSFSRFREMPDWVLSKGTSRLIQSHRGRGFLIDCGSPQVEEYLEKLEKEGVLKGIDGVFVTHYHDDHTDSVESARQRYGCPVYALEEYVDILKNPSHYRLPCMTGNRIEVIKGLPDGFQMEWEEFTFTFRFFPGQTWYHGAVLVHLTHEPEEAVLFAGDSFTPSGVDDYCLWNRNILELQDGVGVESMGYIQCLSMVLDYNRDIPGYGKLPLYIANQHVEPVFEIRESKVVELKEKLSERHELLSMLIRSEIPRNGLDPYWHNIYPYIQHIRAGEEIRIYSTIDSGGLYGVNDIIEVEYHCPDAFKTETMLCRYGVGDKAESGVKIEIPDDVESGLYVVTASIRVMDAHSLREKIVWNHHAECLIVVEDRL